MDIVVDLHQISARLQQSIAILVKALPDQLLLQAIDRFQHHPEISEAQADELLRIALTQLLYLAHMQERDRRLEGSADGTRAS